MGLQGVLSLCWQLWGAFGLGWMTKMGRQKATMIVLQVIG
jgi:hypothetical protein